MTNKVFCQKCGNKVDNLDELVEKFNMSKARRCKHVNDCGYCECEHIVEGVRKSVNSVSIVPDCLFVGAWDHARVMCMGYDSCVEKWEVRIVNRDEVKILGTFDSEERAKKFVDERIIIEQVE